MRVHVECVGCVECVECVVCVCARESVCVGVSTGPVFNGC